MRKLGKCPVKMTALTGPLVASMFVERFLLLNTALLESVLNLPPSKVTELRDHRLLFVDMTMKIIWLILAKCKICYMI